MAHACSSNTSQTEARKIEVKFTSTGRLGGMGVRMISYRSEESYVESVILKRIGLPHTE